MMALFFHLHRIYRHIYHRICHDITGLFVGRSSLPLVGLDINPTYIALAEICRHHDRSLNIYTYELTSFAFIPVTYHLEPQNCCDHDALQRTLTCALAKAQPRSRHVIAALPYSAITLKNATLNYALAEDAIEKFLVLNSEKYFGKDAALVNFDYHVHDKHAMHAALYQSQIGFQGYRQIDSSRLEFTQSAPVVSKRSLLNLNEHCEQACPTAENQNAKDIATSSSTALSLSIVSVNQERVKKYQEFLNKTHLKVTALDVDLFALARSVTLLYPTLELPYTLVQLDPERSIVAVVDDAKVVAAQENFIDESAKYNDQILTQYLLHEVQCVHNQIANSDLNPSITPEQNIRPNVDFFQGKVRVNDAKKSNLQLHLNCKESGNTINSKTVVLCGTNRAVLHELEKMIKEQLHMAAFIADPFNKITLAAPLHHYAEHLNHIAPGMMLCCGLALHEGIINGEL